MSIDTNTREALCRLIAVALRDTGQSRVAADFLLAWWNAKEQGGFDLVDLWSLDDSIAADCCAVFQYIATRRSYPDDLGFAVEFAQIIAVWRKPKRRRSAA